MDMSLTKDLNSGQKLSIVAACAMHIVNTGDASGQYHETVAGALHMLGVLPSRLAPSQVCDHLGPRLPTSAPPLALAAVRAFAHDPLASRL
jgi:hypothetical protein